MSHPQRSNAVTLGDLSNLRGLTLSLRKASIILAVALTVIAMGQDPSSAKRNMIGIGEGEGDRNSLMFETAKGAKIVKVTTRLIVNKVSHKGLNFFALQVNFPNKTWAHGGPQFNKDANRMVHLANWGGLVDRGGGATDYDKADPKKDMALIECGIDKPNTAPWEWKLGCEYILTVERGQEVQLPAGGGHGPEHNIRLGKRKMWEWKFSVVPVDPAKGEPFTSLLYDTADHVDWFCVWNESGYGSVGAEQHARWSVPEYWVEGDDKPKVPSKWTRE